jgi:hydroxymethylbilane synthase
MRTPRAGSTRVIVATRASRLALTQTNLVVDQLKRAHPDLDIEILEVTTTGDRDQRPFAQIGGKGLFTSEVERAIVEGRADLAVHSAKDLTAELGDGCALLAIPKRGPRHDVVLGGGGDTGEERLASLHAGATVGTSSMRRRSLIAEVRRDLELTELRGNMDTRVDKVRSGTVHAAVLAAAGLARLGIGPDAGPLDAEWWVPAPGQGALAVEGLAERDDLRALVAPIEDIASAAELSCERAFAARLEGGCSVPLGCSAVVAGGRMTVTGYLGSAGGTGLRERISGPVAEADALGIELAEAILLAGGDALIVEAEGRDAPTVAEP